MAKKTTLQRAIKRCDKLLWKIIRIRDGKCQKCGRIDTGAPSHVLPKGKYPWLRYDLLNVKYLCWTHHLNWWHKNPMEAFEWFEDKFPVRWEYLQIVRHKVKSMKTDDVLKIEQQLKEKLQELEDEEVMS